MAVVADGSGRDRLHRFDRRLRRRLGTSVLAGVDEVGRGCLAGPVVVCAVVLPENVFLPGVRDSKTLTHRAREEAYLRIREACVAFDAWAVSAPVVDELNVLQASLFGMTRCVERIEKRRGLRVDRVLVDGHQIPRGLADRGIALVKGDGRSLSIAAASVIAKVLRDRVMRAWARRYPQFGFERHVGYPTPEHLAALRSHGPTSLHRRSFAPVAAAASQMRLTFEAGAPPPPHAPK